MFFKNAMFYEQTDSKLEHLASDVLAKNVFRECSAVSAESIGFVSPVTGEANTDNDLLNLAYDINGNILMAIRHDEKILPSSAIKREAKKKADAREKETGEKVGRKELKDLVEETRSKLTPTALVKSSLTYGFINKQSGLVVVDANSAKKAELFLTTVRKALGSFPVVPVDFNKDIGTEMTVWMANNFPIEGLTPMHNASLKLPEEGAAAFKNVDLSDEKILEHINDGARVKKMDLSLDDRVSFCLQDDGTIKKIKMLDLGDGVDGQEEEPTFDGDFILSSAMVMELHGKMEAWFGGE